MEEEDLDSAADDDDDEDEDKLDEQEKNESRPVTFLEYWRHFVLSNLCMILVYNFPRRSFGKTQ